MRRSKSCLYVGAMLAVSALAFTSAPARAELVKLVYGNVTSMT